MDTASVIDHIKATLYGNCIGDTIGLLTEFMVKTEAVKYYGQFGPNLEYEHKAADMHRSRWATGDWTDDSDQMILILDSLVEQAGQADPVDFGQKLQNWCRHGFAELGDYAGMGIGATTMYVLRHEKYKTDPHAAAQDIWEKSGRVVAPNGAVMRTSILGVYGYDNIEQVIHQTLAMCKVTHADPRCQASCVAVTTAIAYMLQRRPEHLKKDGSLDLEALIKDCYRHAKACLSHDKTGKEHAKELKEHMYASSLKKLKLDENKKIGYTYKCMGAGFWALRQDDFRDALQKITFEAGDADTNGAVAGALLGCKLGTAKLPQTWLNGLKHKDWLDQRIDKLLCFMKLKESPVESQGGSTVGVGDHSADGATAMETETTQTCSDSNMDNNF